MNIAGALSEGVLQNPINNIDDMGIIRFHLLELSQFEHLFKIAKGITRQSLCRRFLDGIGNRIKFRVGRRISCPLCWIVRCLMSWCW